MDGDFCVIDCDGVYIWVYVIEIVYIGLNCVYVYGSCYY